MPIEKDAITGPRELEILARVAAQTGDADRAIAALQKLLSIPYSGALVESVPLTPALLRLDPMFDPLRNDVRVPKTGRARLAKRSRRPVAATQLPLPQPLPALPQPDILFVADHATLIRQGSAALRHLSCQPIIRRVAVPQLRDATALH